ncbi:hypothetical protein OH76DRAFT_1365349, partial [Lentinus brumalis]
RVDGVRGLRACDTSVLPEITGSHTGTPTMVRVEECIDILGRALDSRFDGIYQVDGGVCILVYRWTALRNTLIVRTCLPQGANSMPLIQELSTMLRAPRPTRCHQVATYHTPHGAVPARLRPSHWKVALLTCVLG